MSLKLSLSIASRILLLSALLTLVWTSTLTAQSVTGSITGTLADPKGGAIASAQITVINANTGTQRQVTTNDSGEFTIANLDPGVYDLTARMQGFKTLTRKSIALPAAERLVVGTLILEIGAVSESVTVTAQGSTVQVESFERSGVITGTQVESLLIKGRNIYSMIALLPGIQDEREGEQPDSVWGFRALGGRWRTSDISVDGVSVVNMAENYSSTVDVSMDSVAEVKVQTATFQAESGRASGANVKIISKSGTKQFHGLASYFKRHEQFNANNFFNNRLSRPKPAYRFNTWNYSLGGPVIIPGTSFNKQRNKLFFFWSQEFWPTVQSTLGTLTVPTRLEREGDFSESKDVNGKVITVLDPWTRLALPGNKIPAGRIDRSGQALLKMFPETNFLDVAVSGYQYNYVAQRPAVRDYRTQTLKINFNPNSKHFFSVNWSMRTDPRNGYYGQQIYSQAWPQMSINETNKGFGIITRYNTIFSPTFLNELNVGLTRQHRGTNASEEAMKSSRRDVVGFTAGQIDPASNPLKLIPNATFGGISNPAALAIDYRFPANEFNPQSQIADTVTKIFGAHTVKAGINWDYLFADETSAAYYMGQLDFGTSANNPLDSKHPYANALFGVYNSYSEDSPQPRYYDRIKRLEWFLQDTWKAKRRLTLDYGMRFHWLPYPYEKNGAVSGYVSERWQASKAPQLIPPAIVGGKRVGLNPLTGEALPASLIGALAPGSGDPFNGLVVLSQDKSYGRGLVKDPGILLGPRFGFAYDVFGDGKTAVRGGAGMLYNRPWGYDATRLFNRQAPQVVSQTLYYGTLDTLSSGKGYLFPQNVVGQENYGKTPTIYNVSLGIQRNIGFGTVVDAAYVGAFSRHLEWVFQQNDVPLGANWQRPNLDPTNPSVALPANFLRPLRGYGTVGVYQWNSTSSYNSLQVQANRYFAKNLQFGASWTYSKTMAPTSDDRENISPLVNFRSWYRGLASFDRTHMLKMNWVWDLPKVRGFLGRHRVARCALNGWQMSGINSFISGLPLTVTWSRTVALDVTGTTSIQARIVVTGNPVLPKSERTFDRNFRTDVFAMPAVGTLGNAAKYLLRGPGINNWDVAFFKNFRIREPGARLQLRWEMYNAFNHTQFSAMNTGARFDPAGNQVNAQLGSFTAARNPRIMQGSLRFYF